MASMTRCIRTPCNPISKGLALKVSARSRWNPAGKARVALLALVISLASPIAHAQAGEGSYCKRQDFDAFLQTLQPVRGRIALTVSPVRKAYTIGEPVRFSIKSPVAGDLLVMSVDSNGVVFPIFPNQHQVAGSGAKIEANKTLTLPEPDQGFAFETQGPQGASRLIAIVRPAGRELPLPCARPLTKGKEVTIRGDALQSASPAPKVPKVPKIFQGWGYADITYEVVGAPSR
jgi:hypothetical protein